MLKVVASNRFKKDLKIAHKRGLDLTLLNQVVEKLARQEVLPTSLRDHALTGQWSNYRECHIKPDWLLVYRIDEDKVELFLFRTGTHADLFNM